MNDRYWQEKLGCCFGFFVVVLITLMLGSSFILLVLVWIDLYKSLQL